MYQKISSLHRYAGMTVVVVLVLFITSCEGRRQQFVHKYILRWIGVCVLNDIKNPVKIEFISSTLAQIFDEFEEKVGIAMSVVDEKPYAGKLSAFHSDQGAYVRNTCSGENEIRMVFTDESNKYHLLNATGFTKDGEPLVRGAIETDGYADRYYGYILLFEGNKNHRTLNSFGQTLLKGAVLHELGHLFGLDDELYDTRSFMFTSLSGSQGQWTPKNTRMIRSGIHTTWFLSLQMINRKYSSSLQ